MVISFITELEILSLPDISTDSQKIIKGLLKNCSIIDINNTINDIAVNIRRQYKLKLPDSNIAASAYSLQLPLLTADKHFKSIDKIEVILYQL